MTATQHFWDYFRPLCLSQGVGYAQLSDADGTDRLLADSRSTDCYPGVFVLRPHFALRDTQAGTTWGLFRVLCYVFVAAPTDDYDAQDAAYAQAEGIAQGIVRQLYADSRDYRLLFDPNSYQAEPVRPMGADAVWGYEVKLEFGLPVDHLFL